MLVMAARRWRILRLSHVEPSMHMIRQLAIWGWRAWPVITMLLIFGTHVYAIKQFPTEIVFVNRLAGTFMQVVGGLIVLHSVDANLGLFRNHSLATAVISWFRECPIFRRTVTISLTGAAACFASGNASISVIRATT